MHQSRHVAGEKMNKQQPIKKNTECQRAVKKGKAFANRQFIVYSRKGDQEEFRLGLSVSKKVGNAVARNRVKRYIRQAFLELKDDLLPNADYIIIARPQAANLDFHESKKSLEHVLKIARALPKK